MKNDNTALIIEEYDDYVLPEEPQKETKKSKKSSKRPHAKKTSNVGIIVCSIIVTILLFLLIYGKVQVSVLYNQIASEKSTVDILQSENVRMQTEIEANMSLKNVESYAENVLGLKKLEKSQITYIQIQNEDSVEVVETEQNIFIWLKEKFNNIVEYLFG
ncbi:MAG: hypothetical protein ACI4WH_08755 [Oscillospiraceae bacterium]